MGHLGPGEAPTFAAVGWRDLTGDHVAAALAWWPDGVQPIVAAVDVRWDGASFRDVDGSPMTVDDIAARLRDEQVQVAAYVKAVALESRGELPAGTVAGWRGAGRSVVPAAGRRSVDGDRWPLTPERLRYLVQAAPGVVAPVLRAVGLVVRPGPAPDDPVLTGPVGLVTDLEEAFRRLAGRPDLRDTLQTELYQCWMDEGHSGIPRAPGGVP